MEIQTSENLRLNGSYSTVFQSNKPTLGVMENPLDGSFTIGPPAGLTTIVMSGFYARAGNQCRVEWRVSESKGYTNYFVNTPQVDDAIDEIKKRLEDANPGFSFSPVTTWLLSEDIPLPEGISDIAEKGINKVGGAVSGAVGSITKPVLIIGGIVAVGLAVGLSRSRVGV